MLRKNTLALATLIGFSSSISAPIYAADSLVDDKNIAFAGVDICAPDIIQTPAILRSAGVAENAPVVIEADELETDNDIIDLAGNARIIQGNRGVFADNIQYQQQQYTAHANGNVKYYTVNGDEVSAESLDIEIDTFIGTASKAKMKIANSNPTTGQPSGGFLAESSLSSLFTNDTTQSIQPRIDPNENYVRSRATAETMDFQGSGHQVLHDATLTSCKEGNQDVVLYAKKIELDHLDGTGTAKSMTLKFKNVPIFYLPTVTFPITDERKSGFLFPTIGSKQNSGAILSIPYYINIAPNHDATITPILYSKRGLKLHGEYRYLTKTAEGEITASFLPQDRVFKKDRYSYRLTHDQQLSENWSTSIELQDISDTQYLRDFNNDIEASSTSYFPQNAELNYQGNFVEAEIKTNSYKYIDATIPLTSRPYQKPLEISIESDDFNFGLIEVGADAEYIDFRHKNRASLKGNRTTFTPYISIPIDKVYGFVTPKIALQNISYSLANTAANSNQSPSLSVPIFSIDSGLFFERPVSRKDNSYTQTLEPRLFYVKIPSRLNQNTLPRFDTGLSRATTSFDHLFRENRFFGGDRIGDTEHVVAVVSSRFIDDATDTEQFKFSVGQIFYLADRVIRLSSTSSPSTDSTSDLFAEAEARINQNWSVDSFVIIDDKSRNVNYIDTDLNYYRNDRLRYSIGHRLTRARTKGQVNLEFSAPIAPKWQLSGVYNYSLDDSQSRVAETQIAYDDCCWAAGVTFRRIRNRNGVPDDGIFFTFQLDDFGSLRNKL